MLRDEKLLSAKMTPGMRMGMIAALAAASLAVAGLRGTAADRKTVVDGSDRSWREGDDGMPKTERNPRPARNVEFGSGSAAIRSRERRVLRHEGAVEPFSLAWVPRDAVAVAASVRPSC